MRVSLLVAAAAAFAAIGVLGGAESDFRPGLCEDYEHFPVCCHSTWTGSKINCEKPKPAIIKNAGHMPQAGHMCPQSTYRQLYCCKNRNRDRRYFQCKRPKIFGDGLRREDPEPPSFEDDDEDDDTVNSTIPEESPESTQSPESAQPPESPESPEFVELICQIANVSSNATSEPSPASVPRSVARRAMHPGHEPHPNPDAKRFTCPQSIIPNCPTSATPHALCCNPSTAGDQPRGKCAEATSLPATYGDMNQPVKQCSITWEPVCCDDWRFVTEKGWIAQSCKAPLLVA